MGITKWFRTHELTKKARHLRIRDRKISATEPSLHEICELLQERSDRTDPIV